MRKNLISILMISLLIISALPLILASNGKVIVTSSQLQIEQKNQYQTSTGETVDAKLTKEQARERIQMQVEDLFKQQLGEKITELTQDQIETQSQELIQEQDIEIVEVQDDLNNNRIAYRFQVNQEGKIFGLFKKQIQVRTDVDVETGEILSMKKPWYNWMMSFGY